MLIYTFLFSDAHYYHHFIIFVVISFIPSRCSLPSVQKRYVAIARLKYATNLGRTSQETRFIILVIAPTREKGTKNALETARTFATLLADMDCRQTLLEVKTGKKNIWLFTRNSGPQGLHL